MLALPILPGRYQPSIVGRGELNYRVRNGNGWTLVLISTNCSFAFDEQTNYKRSATKCQAKLAFSRGKMVTRTGFEPMLTA